MVDLLAEERELEKVVILLLILSRPTLEWQLELRHLLLLCPFVLWRLDESHFLIYGVIYKLNFDRWVVVEIGLLLGFVAELHLKVEISTWGLTFFHLVLWGGVLCCALLLVLLDYLVKPRCLCSVSRWSLLGYDRFIFDDGSLSIYHTSLITSVTDLVHKVELRLKDLIHYRFLVICLHPAARWCTLWDFLLLKLEVLLFPLKGSPSECLVII